MSYVTRETVHPTLLVAAVTGDEEQEGEEGHEVESAVEVHHGAEDHLLVVTDAVQGGHHSGEEVEESVEVLGDEGVQLGDRPGDLLTLICQYVLLLLYNPLLPHTILHGRLEVLLEDALLLLDTLGEVVILLEHGVRAVIGILYFVHDLGLVFLPVLNLVELADDLRMGQELGEHTELVVSGR